MNCMITLRIDERNEIVSKHKSTLLSLSSKSPKEKPPPLTNPSPQLLEIRSLLRAGENPVVVYPGSLWILDGDRNAAVVLQELLYWSDKGKDEEGWIYKTQEDLGEKLWMSGYIVAKSIKTLLGLGLIEVKRKPI